MKWYHQRNFWWKVQSRSFPNQIWPNFAFFVYQKYSVIPIMQGTLVTCQPREANMLGKKDFVLKKGKIWSDCEHAKVTLKMYSFYSVIH